MARSIYVPLLPEELALLGAMAEQERRNPHDQAAQLIAEGLRRWWAEQTLERSLAGEPEEEKVA